MPDPLRLAYETDRVRLYHGDCADLPDALEPASIDCVVTDPPYGVTWASNYRKGYFTRIVGDTPGELDVPTVLGVITLATLQDARHVYVFGYAADALNGPLRLGSSAELIWDKGIMGMGDVSAPWGPAHENITFGAHHRSQKHRNKGRGRLSARLRAGSVLRHDRKNGRSVTRHPTEKPVGLLAQLIESSTLRGETVLDPFAGCMSTGVAALITGRRAVLCEVDEQYIGPGIERLRAAEHATANLHRL